MTVSLRGLGADTVAVSISSQPNAPGWALYHNCPPGYVFQTPEGSTDGTCWCAGITRADLQNPDFAALDALLTSKGCLVNGKPSSNRGTTEIEMETTCGQFKTPKEGPNGLECAFDLKKAAMSIYLLPVAILPNSLFAGAGLAGGAIAAMAAGAIWIGIALLLFSSKGNR